MSRPSRDMAFSAVVAAACLAAAAMLVAASVAWPAMLSGYGGASSAGGGAASNSFETMNAPSGTDPVASSATDTLNFTATGIVTITGNSSTDTLTFGATEVDGSTTNEIQNLFETVSTSSGTAPVADSATDTLTLTGTSPVTVTGTSGTDTVTFSLADITPDCSAGQFVNAVGANGALTCAQPGNVTGNAATATALASNPTACSANQFVTDIADTGTLTCAQPSFSNISGTLALSQVTDDATASKCLLSGGAGGDPAWGSCGSGSGITGITGGTGGTTTGTTVTMAGGDGITTTRSTDTITIATQSDETNFLTSSSEITCSSSMGRMLVDTTAGTLSWCNTSTKKWAALGNDSDGSAVALNTGAGTDGSRGITFTDNSSSNPGVGASGETVIHTKTGVGYVLPYHAVNGPGYQIQASQVALGHTSTQLINTTALADLTNISFTVKAGKKYWLQGSLSAVASSSTADPKFAVKLSVITGSPVIAVRGSCSLATNTATSSFLLTASDTSDDCIIGSGQTVVVIFDGYIFAGADATLTVRGAPSGTGDLTIDAYPLFRLTEFQ